VLPQPAPPFAAGAPAGTIRRKELDEALAAYEQCTAVAGGQAIGWDAVGMAGACLVRMDDYPGALLRYCRQLATLPQGQDETAPFVSARACLRRLSPADHRRFQSAARQEPAVAAVYLDLLLHYDRTGARTNYQLGLFALDVLKRHRAPQLTGPLLTRLSLIEDRAGHYARAEKLASAALARCAKGRERDQAHWQRALTLRHLSRDREALAEYEHLASGANLPRLRRAAREAAAVLCERTGDYPRALYHYFALGYPLDYAYVADCLASEKDLAAFLKRYPDHPRAKLVRYSLGFRQLRTGQYAAAEKTLAPLGAWLGLAEKKYPCNTSKDRPRTPPLQAARLLAGFERREKAARTKEQKAVIAYEHARFLFYDRHLLFYNGALWAGMRTYGFQLQGQNNIQEPGRPIAEPEKQQYARYQQEHAALYHALKVFDRIAAQYPGTPQAPKALYSAALCCTFLPSLESYWNSDDTPDWEAEAIRRYRRLQREYPHDPLVPAAERFGGKVVEARK
jgi:hypothetical protein